MCWSLPKPPPHNKDLLLGSENPPLSPGSKPQATPEVGHQPSSTASSHFPSPGRTTPPRYPKREGRKEDKRERLGPGSRSGREGHVSGAMGGRGPGQ